LGQLRRLGLQTDRGCDPAEPFCGESRHQGNIAPANHAAAFRKQCSLIEFVQGRRKVDATVQEQLAFQL
jgi:hypothetical protein